MANIIQIKPVEGYVVTDPATNATAARRRRIGGVVELLAAPHQEGAVELLQTTAKKGAK